ncbi:MAG: hypothetical protein QM817_17570 [Archangium sp.]
MVLPFVAACSAAPSPDAGPGPQALDGGFCFGPPPKNDLLAFLGERADVSLGASGCDPSLFSLSVTDPAGVSIPVELNLLCSNLCELQARFTPLVEGVHSIELLNEGRPFARRATLVIEAQSLGFRTSTFLDRMDDCRLGPYRTSNGIVLCKHDQDIAAYAPDGGRVEFFRAASLAVLGTDVWTMEGAQFRHLTAIDDGTLRDDGVAQSPPISSWFDTTVRNGSIINTSALDGWVEVSFDGGVLSSTFTPASFSQQFFGPGPTSFIPEPGVGAFTTNLCVASPGCQPPLTCEPTVTCPSSKAVINSIGEHAVFSVFSPNFDSSMTVGAIARPLEPPLTWSPFQLDMPTLPVVPILHPGLESPAFQVGSRVVFLELVDGTVKLRAFSFPGKLASVTDDWVISTDPSNPMKIFYAPSPIRYR